MGRKLPLPSFCLPLQLINTAYIAWCNRIYFQLFHNKLQGVTFIFVTTIREPDMQRYESEKYFTDPSTKEKLPFPSLADEASLDLSVIVPSYNEELRCKFVKEKDWIVHYQNLNTYFQYKMQDWWNNFPVDPAETKGPPAKVISSPAFYSHMYIILMAPDTIFPLCIKANPCAHSQCVHLQSFEGCT